MDGEVIGINTAILSPSGGSIGIGFATPSDTVLPVIDQLREFHETRRGWLGVRIQNVDDGIADSLGLGKPRGALIAGIDDKGPAKPAGLKAGDVILTFDGKDVKESRDLPAIVAATPVGKDVAIGVFRDGKEQTVTVKLGRLEDTDKQAAANSQDDQTPAAPEVKSALGMSLSALSDDLRKKYSIKDTVKGVVVTDVDASSAAGSKGIKAGDIVTEINQEAVNAPADIAAKLKSMKDAGKKSALLLVSNGEGEVRFVAVTLD
jgi:serine protease Do